MMEASLIRRNFFPNKYFLANKKIKNHQHHRDKHAGGICFALLELLPIDIPNMIAWIYSENGSSGIPEHRHDREEKSLCVFLGRVILSSFEKNQKNARTLKLSFEALSEPIYNRLDIFYDAIDTTNTPALFKMRQTTP